MARVLPIRLWVGCDHPNEDPPGRCLHYSPIENQLPEEVMREYPGVVVNFVGMVAVEGRFTFLLNYN